MNKAKQIIALHDLAGLGRSSLGVIIPTLSAMGTQVIAVPTAVLSSHTGGFEDVAVTDLTHMLPVTLMQYRKLDIQPAAVYSGYLGSYQQIELVASYFSAYPSSLKLVDPVMGDDGELYSKIDDKLVKGMKSLVKQADIITPNLTEAHLLLGRQYTKYSSLDEYKNLAVELARISGDKVLLKGIKLNGDTIINLFYSGTTGSIHLSTHEYVKASYPGTGDIFASVFIGCKNLGFSDQKALKTSGEFLSYTIKFTNTLGTGSRYGVELEKCLSWFYVNNVLREAGCNERND